MINKKKAIPRFLKQKKICQEVGGIAFKEQRVRMATDFSTETIESSRKRNDTVK